MYRIELAPGEETVFRTIEELAIGVRNGVVTVRARIYHNASQKWLPIEFHPHYKQALTIPATRLAEIHARPPERAEAWTFAVARPAPEPVAPVPAAPDASPEAPSEPTLDESDFGAPDTEPAALSEPRIDPAVVSAPSARVPHAPVVSAGIARSSDLPVASASPAPAPDAPAMSLPMARASDAPVDARAVAIRPSPVEHPGAAERMGTSGRVAVSEPAALVEQVLVAERVVATAEPVAPEMVVPSVVESPVRHLPTISYPEFTPVEEPVAEPRVSAGRSRRPIQLAGAALVLALGGYGMMFARSPSRGDPPSAPTLADRSALPALNAGVKVTAASGAEVVERGVAPGSSPNAATANASSPSRAGAGSATSVQLVTPPPASSGFAPALEARAIVAGAPPGSIAGAPTGAAPLTPDPAITPAPIEVDLAVPTLPGDDSLFTSTRPSSDSAMKRILKAVNGGKEIPQRP